MHDLRSLDKIRDELQERLPGWRIWFVPLVNGVSWSAQPLPLLTADGPEELTAAIRRAHFRAAEHPALAYLDSYREIAPGVSLAGE